MKLIPDEPKSIELSLLSISQNFIQWINRDDFNGLVEAYIDALSEIQKKINLTGSCLRQDLLHHIQESLEMFFLLEEHYKQEVVNLLDIGSGGGFPAIPLACALPSWRIIMTEATQKKAIFLEWIKLGLNLTNAFVHPGRVEEWIEKKPSYRCDILTAKGVGKAPYLMNLARDLLKPKGLLILWKNMLEVEDQLRPYPDFIIHSSHTTLSGKMVLALQYIGKKARVR
jgi:16S rRNA (guanine527-N7)-methyltransferase